MLFHLLSFSFFLSSSVIVKHNLCGYTADYFANECVAPAQLFGLFFAFCFIYCHAGWCAVAIQVTGF